MQHGTDSRGLSILELDFLCARLHHATLEHPIKHRQNQQAHGVVPKSEVCVLVPNLHAYDMNNEKLKEFSAEVQTIFNDTYEEQNLGGLC